SGNWNGIISGCELSAPPLPENSFQFGADDAWACCSRGLTGGCLRRAARPGDLLHFPRVFHPPEVLAVSVRELWFATAGFCRRDWVSCHLVGGPCGRVVHCPDHRSRLPAGCSISL